MGKSKISAQIVTMLIYTVF